MRKLILRILLLGVIFLVFARVWGGFDNIDKKQSANPNVIRIANAPRFDSLDILFVGSSASYSGIIPTMFDSIGIRSYNLSVAAAGPFFYKLLVDDYLHAVQEKPVSVWFLLMPSTFMEHADDFREIGIHRYLNHPLSNEAITRRYGIWSSYPSLLIKSFQKGVKNIVHKDKAAPQVIEREIADRGFYRSDETTSTAKERKEAGSYAGFRKQVFNTAKADYLLRYADSLRQQGIRIVFFSLPGNKMNSFFSETFMQEYQKFVVSTQAKYPFVHIEGLQTDSSHFRNSDHLNTKGAIMVTNKIIADGLSGNTPNLFLKDSTVLHN